MTTDITELAQRVERIISDMKLKHGVKDTYAPVMKWDEFLALVEALEKAQGMEAYWKTQCRGITDHCEELQARIAELEREQEQLRPVGVMSEQAFHRLENRECRFIALWPRPGIFLPRKRPEDGVIVYARTAAAAGIKVEQLS